MAFCRQFELLAAYNEWMNANVYEAAMRLPLHEIELDRLAYFKSIRGTLNHIAVGDTLWLQRFANHPAHYAALDPMRQMAPPVALDQMMFPSFESLFAYRKRLDGIIKEWVATVAEEDLQHILAYSTTKGVATRKRFFELMLHFFNHQTHHRGQASVLLCQAGEDVGVTDLLALVPVET
ncbi:MAG TPA: DinB family protein [Burkholderiales bacterium]|nr:DinB family protein [Burkholderiales bacterium]